MKKMIKTKVIDHFEDKMVPHLTRTKVYKEVDTEIDLCDICGKGYLDGIPVCLGCGRAVCYICNRETDLDLIQLWVGEQEEYGDNYHTPGSDDFDTEHFYLCSKCKENPPDKIKFMNKQKIIDKLEDDIKKVTQEMIRDAREVMGK